MATKRRLAGAGKHTFISKMLLKIKSDEDITKHMVVKAGELGKLVKTIKSRYFIFSIYKICAMKKYLGTSMFFFGTILFPSSCATEIVFLKGAHDEYVPDCGFVLESSYYPNDSALEVSVHMQNNTDYIWYYHGVPCDTIRILKSLSVKIIDNTDTITVAMKALKDIKNDFLGKVNHQVILHCKFIVVRLLFENNQPDKVFYLKRYKKHSFNAPSHGC